MIKCRLRELLASTSMSQSDLAQKVGTNKNTINKMYHNKLRKYDMEIVERICTYFGISVEAFFYQDQA